MLIKNILIDTHNSSVVDLPTLML